MRKAGKEKKGSVWKGGKGVKRKEERKQEGRMKNEGRSGKNNEDWQKHVWIENERKDWEN